MQLIRVSQAVQLSLGGSQSGMQPFQLPLCGGQPGGGLFGIKPGGRPILSAVRTFHGLGQALYQLAGAGKPHLGGGAALQQLRRPVDCGGNAEYVRRLGGKCAYMLQLEPALLRLLGGNLL